MRLPDTMIFEKFGTKNKCHKDFRSFEKDSTWPKWLQNLGLKIAKEALQEAQLKSHLDQVKSLSNDLKLVGH